MRKIHSLSRALNRFINIGIFLVVVSCGINAEEEVWADKQLTVDQLQEDFRQI